MRKLGDQWIEVIDGVEHMFKAVTPIVNGYTDIKDLGVLKDGRLPCPFCGEYTEILKGKLGYRIRHVCRDSYVIAGTGIYGTDQQAIDAWNRRV